MTLIKVFGMSNCVDEALFTATMRKQGWQEQGWVTDSCETFKVEILIRH